MFGLVSIIGSILVIAVFIRFRKDWIVREDIIYKYSFKKEIAEDLRKKGYQLLDIEVYDKKDTIWKDELDVDFSRLSATVYRKVVYLDKDDKEHLSVVRYEHHDIFPSAATYDPPLPNEDDTTE